MSWLNWLFRRKENPKWGKNRFQIPAVISKILLSGIWRRVPIACTEDIIWVLIWAPEHRQLLLGWWGGGWVWFPCYMRRGPTEIESSMSERKLHTERAAGVGSRDLSAVYVQEHDQGKMGKLIKPGKLCSPVVCTAGIITWAIPEWKADMPEASLLFMPSLFGPFKNSHLRYLKR